MKILIIIIAFLTFIEIFLFFLLKRLQKIKWVAAESKIFSLLEKKKFDKFKKFNFNEHLGWDIKPLKKNNKKKKSNSYLIDSMGRRDSRFKKYKQIISTFGDSYVFCRQVSDQDTWQEQLSPKKKIYVANYGVGNYGLDQAFLKFKRKKLTSKNKVIIFGFVPETICRIQSKWKHFIEFGNIHGFKPSISIRNKKLTFEKNFLKKKDKFQDLFKIISQLKKKDRFYQEKYFKFSFRFPYSISFLKNLSVNFKIILYYFFLGNKNVGEIEQKVFPAVMENNIKMSHKLYSENYSLKLLRKLLYEINNVVKKKKMKCIFIIFPQLFDLKLNTNKNYTSFYKVHNNNLNILDLTESFLKLKDYSKYYINDKYGGHLNKKGNNFVANILYKKLTK